MRRGATDARRLQWRYAAEQNAELKNRWARTALDVLSFSTEPPEGHLAFLRQLAAEVPDEYRSQYIDELFQAVVNWSWSETRENEAFDLLERLHGRETPERQAVERIRALHELTDRMLGARLAMANRGVEHPERLDAHRACRQRSRKSPQDPRRVRRAAGRRSQTHRAAGGVDRGRTALPRHALESQSGTSGRRLLEGPRRAVAGNRRELGRSRVLRAELDYALRNRSIVTLLNLAARKNASPR